MIVKNTIYQKECDFCSYTWAARIKNPKSCPRCKRRFDYEEAKEILKRIGKEFGYNLTGISKGGPLRNG